VLILWFLSALPATLSLHLMAHFVTAAVLGEKNKEALCNPKAERR
jgi:hypothetical protein